MGSYKAAGPQARQRAGRTWWVYFLPCVSGVQPCGLRKPELREEKAKEKAAQGQKRPKAWPKRRCLSWPWALDPLACVTLIQSLGNERCQHLPQERGQEDPILEPWAGATGAQESLPSPVPSPPASSQSSSLGHHLVVKWSQTETRAMTGSRLLKQTFRAVG